MLHRICQTNWRDMLWYFGRPWKKKTSFPDIFPLEPNQWVNVWICWDFFGHHGMNSRHFRAESNPRQKQVKEKVTWKGHERRNNLSKNNCCPTDLLKKVPFGALRWWNHCLNPLQDTILRPFSSDVPGALATDWASRVATRGTSNCTDSSKIWLNATWTPLGAPQQWHQRIKDGELPGYHEL